VIATKDRPRLVREAVASVLAGSAQPTEILVVDQSAVPAELELPGERDGLAVCTLAAPALGVSAGRNRGIAAASHEIVVMIDDDMLVERDWFGALVDGLVRGGARCVVTGRVVPGAPEMRRGFTPASAVSEEPAAYRGRIGMDVLAGGNMAARKKDLVEVGLFDERLGPGTAHPAAEDNDLGYRLLEAGYEIVYLPGATAIHRAWRSDGDYLRYRWRYGRGKGGFYTKHLSLDDRYMLGRMSGDIGNRARRFPRSLLRRRRLAAGDVAYSAGILAGATSWMLKERVRRRGGP